MNRIELCQRLLTEADINGTIGSTIGQVGDFGRAVNWIDTAYSMVQASKQTWRYLRSEKSIALSVGVAEYSDSTVARWIPDDFRVYLTSTGVSDETPIQYVPWPEFRESYQIGATRTQAGRPAIFSIKPDGKLIYYPIPDAAYTCRGEGYSVPDTMASDTDTPLIPEQFHMVLVWGALKLFGAWNSEGDKYTHGDAEYRRLLRLLEADQLETVEFGEPLA